MCKGAKSPCVGQVLARKAPQRAETGRGGAGEMGGDKTWQRVIMYSIPFAKSNFRKERWLPWGKAPFSPLISERTSGRCYRNTLQRPIMQTTEQPLAPEIQALLDAFERLAPEQKRVFTQNFLRRSM